MSKALPIIKEVLWNHYQIPLSASFNTAHQALAKRAGAIIEIYTDTDIIGVGEAAPLPEFAGGSMQDVLSCLPLVAKRLLNKRLSEAKLILRDELNTMPSAAIYGIETALLDIQGQSEQRSLGSILFQSSSSHLPRDANHTLRSEIDVNTVIGTIATEAAVALAHKAVTAGFSCIKLKLGHDLDAEVERVAAIRQAIGPSIHLRLDANEGWTREQAHYILRRCVDFNIQYVEQPLARYDLSGMRILRQAIPIPIAADEILSDLASAQRVLAAQAADIFIIKPQLAGGLYAAQRLLQLATEHNIKCVITSSIEAGIGIAAALHLAASAPAVTLACGLGTLPILANDLIYAALPIYKGHMCVPTGSGLGVELDRGALETFSIFHQRTT